jgi:hypothetical protein
MPRQAVASVVGLKALMKDVDRLCKDERGPLWNAMKRAGYAAVSPIVGRTRESLPHSDRRSTRTHKPGQLAASVRASAYRSGAATRMGGKNAAMAGWVEFGGTRRRPHFSERPFVRSGRYMYPAAKTLGPAAAQNYTKAVNEIFGRTAIWTNSKTNPESVHD